MKILLDLDGVLADFVSATLVRHRRGESHDQILKWDYFTDWGMTDAEFWAPLRGGGFWTGIKPYPWAREFYRKLATLGEVTIATAPNLDPECIPAKIKWVEQHLGVDQDHVMCGRRKHLMASPGTLLIDDGPHNIARHITELAANLEGDHELAGRHAILFPQPWNGGTGDWIDVLHQVKEMTNGR